jgi:hypothetical protein
VISGLLVALVVIGLLSAALLARGGKAGPETANPYWFLLSGANILLVLHVLGVLLPGSALVPWTAIALAFAGFAAAGLRELSLWTHDLLPRPGNREFIMEVILIVTGVLTANIMSPQLPDAPQFTVIAVVLVPLIMVRWASTRLVVPAGRPSR